MVNWYQIKVLRKGKVYTKWKTTGKSISNVISNLTPRGKESYKKGKLKITRSTPLFSQGKLFFNNF